jgi:hypothetical protein
MTKLFLTVREAKIICTDKVEPKKAYYPDGKFKLLNFAIAPRLQCRNPNTETGYENKVINYNCVMFNETLANQFFNQFDRAKRNYITIISGQLNNFQEHYIKQTSEATNKEYDIKAFSLFSLIVNDFVITYKDKQIPQEYNDYSKYEDKSTGDPYEGLNDDSPF